MPDKAPGSRSSAGGSKGKSGGSTSRGTSGGASRHVGAPVSGRISSSYGTRKDPVSKKSTTHHGVDIAVKANTPIRSTGGGTVTRAGWQNAKNHKEGYGQRVTINHGNGRTSTYGHLNSTAVKVGDKVKGGQVVGRSGSTGKSTGPHVHYEERYKGKPQSPTYHPDRSRAGKSKK